MSCPLRKSQLITNLFNSHYLFSRLFVVNMFSTYIHCLITTRFIIAGSTLCHNHIFPIPNKGPSHQPGCHDT